MGVVDVEGLDEGIVEIYHPSVSGYEHGNRPVLHDRVVPVSRRFPSIERMHYRHPPPRKQSCRCENRWYCWWLHNLEDLFLRELSVVNTELVDRATKMLFNWVWREVSTLCVCPMLEVPCCQLLDDPGPFVACFGGHDLAVQIKQHPI